jgi:hypothetical protein
MARGALREPKQLEIKGARQVYRRPSNQLSAGVQPKLVERSILLASPAC